MEGRRRVKKRFLKICEKAKNHFLAAKLLETDCAGLTEGRSAKELTVSMSSKKSQCHQNKLPKKRLYNKTEFKKK